MLSTRRRAPAHNAPKFQGDFMRAPFRMAASAALVFTAGLIGAAQPGPGTPATASLARDPLAGTPIVVAPTFTLQQLLAAPQDAWITNGGTLYNPRWSPLTLLNRDNVKGLRALWRTGTGMGSATGRNNMPTFREIYDVNQLRDVSEFIIQGLGRQNR
jgi:glucose dehydrogenase